MDGEIAHESSSAYRCPIGWSKYPLLREEMVKPPAGNAAIGLLRSAERHPQMPAYAYGGRTGSYSKLLRRSFRYANGLKSIGIHSGDRVAIYLPSHPEAIAAYYGVLLAGAIAVPLHEGVEPEEAIRRMRETEAAAIVASRRLMPEVGRLREAIGVIKVIVIEERRGIWTQKEAARAIWSTVRERLTKKGFNSANGLALLRRSSGKGDGAARNGEDRAVIQYSNGTTGLAQGAVLTHGAILAGACCLAYWQEGVHAEEEGSILRAPLLHPAGLAALNASVHRAGCLQIAAASNGAATRPASHKGTYWIAGAASPVLAIPPGSRAKEGALGYALPTVEARIVGENDLDELPPNAVGELAVRGPQTAVGYWGNRALPEEGWIRTGDMARKDEEGCFYWADRKENRFVAEQGMVAPLEVETILSKHPAVKRACVIAAEEGEGGVISIAMVILHKGRIASPAQLDRWCRDRAGRRGLPVRYEFVDAIPSTLWGEALKRELQSIRSR